MVSMTFSASFSRINLLLVEPTERLDRALVDYKLEDMRENKNVNIRRYKGLSVAHVSKFSAAYVGTMIMKYISSRMRSGPS